MIMSSKESYTILFFISLLVLVFVDAEPLISVHPVHPIGRFIGRSSFPKDFVFGAGSSAYQYEGAAFEDGKGPSIWDNYTHKHPERIVDHSNGDVALDSYHRYKEDIAIMKQIGLDAYRFSIAWTRILPKGKLSGGLNKEGIVYYNNLINELIANGIQPYVTLFHWDVPQALEDEYHGFLSHQIVDDFVDYVDICFKEFGDRVKYWTTLNEQYIFATQGYGSGQHAPGRCSSSSSLQAFDCHGGDAATEPYIVGHNQILAHAATVKLYKTKYQPYQKGVIGISFVTVWYVPYSDSDADNKATSRATDFTLGWFLHPLVYGDYPPSMRALVRDRLPKFTKEETSLITGSFDFIGINYYTAYYAKDDPNAAAQKPSYLTDYRATLTTDRDGVSIGPKVNASSPYAVYPQGLKELLIYVKNNYKSPIIYITENGYFDYDIPEAHKLIKDELRIKFYHDHLINLQEAMRVGVKVKGFFVWSLLDGFEWASGYAVRFGITYIDHKNNLKRISKDSAKWFNTFLRT